MKKFLVTILMCMPLALTAQNTWEMIEEPEEEETAKVNPDQKYLTGAVPVVDGHVVFTTTIEAPGKSADDIYQIVLKYMRRMVREKNQIQSNVGVTDSVQHVIGGTYQEWLIFRSNALAVDRTRLYFTFVAECSDGQVKLTMNRIHYLYDEERKPLKYKAEEWITDKYAINKKHTKLLPISGKFRRKTIDRKDFLFNKIESLLK